MCILRVSGKEFKPEKYLSKCNFDAYSIFFRGDKIFEGLERTYDTSGFKVHVSEAEWSDRDEQIQDALRFLRKFSVELKQLINWEGVEDVRLDFPFNATGVFTYIRCPVELSRESSMLGIALEFSVYPEAET